MTIVSYNRSVVAPVEMCVNSTWRRVCSSSWRKEDAQNFCKQLNLNYTGERLN